jgi:peptidyl-prolyl cis-trans isomerase B (cyclophilin B)
MTDLEELFHDAAALADQAATPTGDVMARLHSARTAYRRRRRAMFAIPVAAAAVVAVPVALSLAPRGDGASLVPADGGSVVAATPSPPGCTASGGAVCIPAPARSPASEPTNGAATTCSYRQTSPDAATLRYRQTTAGRKVGLPPATPGALPVGATLHTIRGDISIALRPETACTVNSFVHLVEHHYYDDTPCFRLTTAGIYVLQCGDPSATGSGGPGYAYDDEHLSGTTYPAGTVAMANSGPDSNGSQFFLVYKDTQLDASYTVFGHITSGLDVVTEIAAKGSTPASDGQPNVAVDVQSVTIG